VNTSKENPYISSLKSARLELEDAEEAMRTAHRRRREAVTQAATVGALSMGLIAKELGISRTLAYRILKE
jgi:transcriptional regulator of acetoin/glycerol metabolism